MGIYNTTQNEIGGKELLLKAATDFAVATTGASTSFVITAHGAKVGDLIKFGTIGGNTAFDTTSFYFVKTIVDANTVTISDSRAGAAITADETEAALTCVVFKSVGGLRSKSFSFQAEGIDISNQESDEWKVMLDGAGIRSFSVSGGGVYTNQAVFQGLFTKARANTIAGLMFIEVKTDTIFEGAFKITSLEISGDYDAESNYSISAESSGAINVVTIA